MAIVTISRGSFSRGAEVAEKVARRLGFVCLGRDALLEAAKEYDVSEIKLVHAIEDPPSTLDRITGGRMRYVSYIKAALLRRFREDNIVYHGLAAGLLLLDVPHVLNVRVLADLEDRIRIVIARDGGSEARARQLLAKRDKARRLWGQQLHGFDLEDPSLYDAVVHVGKMGTDGATDVICNLVAQEAFQSTAASQSALEDLALVAALEALVVDLDVDLCDVEVTASGGRARIGVRAHSGVRDGTSRNPRSYFLKDLRGRLQQRAAELGARVTVELIEPQLSRAGQAAGRRR